MGNLFQEIQYASHLLASDKKARKNNAINGQVAPKIIADIKRWLAIDVKKTMQKFNENKALYIKSYFFNRENNNLVLYTRIYKQEKIINVKYDNGQFFFTSEAGNIPISIKDSLTFLLSYHIASDVSYNNHKPINLMPAWRR